MLVKPHKYESKEMVSKAIRIDKKTFLLIKEFSSNGKFSTGIREIICQIQPQLEKAVAVKK